MNFNINGEKTPLVIDYKRVGYASLLIVDKTNKDSRGKFLLNNTYAKGFINSMPGRFGVINIYIKKEERNKGYGTYFMRKIIEFFKGKVEILHLLPYPIIEKKEHFDHMKTSFFIMQLVKFFKKFDFVMKDPRYNLTPMFLQLSNRHIRYI
ncbi:GNAT family N-acetyltransferase [Bacillus cereus]|uniref:GNAT family N-acetyltransferase n=1 Tax=Bacillus cereus TaxID=1396 RepID=UPI000945137F|nr:GNAT family N-acetyltransferase [Bacillus cereus]